MKLALAVLLSYFIGSVSVSILLSRRLFQNDIRNNGSGNAGATNVARVFGWGAGLATFAGDFVKGILSMALGLWLGGEPGMALAGMSCLLGHCFPIYYGFRGGKAVSVGAAVALMIDWRLFAAVMAVFLLVALSTRLVSLASMSAAVAVAVLTVLLFPSPWRIALALFAAALLIFMHRSNIGRLVQGNELKFKPGHRPERK